MAVPEICVASHGCCFTGVGMVWMLYWLTFVQPSCAGHYPASLLVASYQHCNYGWKQKAGGHSRGRNQKVLYPLWMQIILWGNFIPGRPEWERLRGTLWHVAQDKSSHALAMSGCMGTMCASVTYTHLRSLQYRVLFVAESTAGLGVSMDSQMFVLLYVQLYFTSLHQRGKHPGSSVLLLMHNSIRPSSAHILDSVIGKSQCFPPSPPAGMKSQQLPLADAKPLFALLHTNKAGCFRQTLEVGKMWGLDFKGLMFWDEIFFFPHSQDGLYWTF